MVDYKYKTSIKDIQDKYKFKLFGYDLSGASIKEYNDNATSKISEYNSNHTTKLSEYNTNATTKLNDYNTNAAAKTTTFNNNAESYEKRIEHYKKYSNALIHEKQSGTELTFDNTAESPMEVDLFGNTSQETTTGKNIFNASEFIAGDWWNSQYFSKGSNENELIVKNANAQQWNQMTLRFADKIVIGHNYYFSCVGASSIEVNSVNNIVYNGITATFTASANGIKIKILASSYPTTIKSIMLIDVTETDDRTYEPYTGGIASPNPDYPQEIKGVKGDNEIVVCNKNLFDKNNLTNGYRLAPDGVPYPDNSYSLTDYIRVKPNTTYYRNKTISMMEALCLYDKNKNCISRLTSGTSFTTTGNTYYIRTDVLTTNIDTCQLEQGPTATSYVEHKGATYPLSLGNIEMCKIGDYKDTFVKDNGVWYKKEVIKKLILNGTEGWDCWNVGNDYVGFYYYYNLKKLGAESKINNALYCDKFSEANTKASISNGTVEGIKHCGGTASADLQYIGVGINKLRLTDSSTKALAISSFKNWLSENKPVVYCVLLNPTLIEITDTTLISQLDNLQYALSYQGQTNITQVNSELPFEMDVDTVKDLNAIITNINNAIIEIGGE